MDFGNIPRRVSRSFVRDDPDGSNKWQTDEALMWKKHISVQL